MLNGGPTVTATVLKQLCAELDLPRTSVYGLWETGINLLAQDPEVRGQGEG